LILSATLISKEFLSEECLKQVRAHGDYDTGNGSYNSPFTILEIIKKIFAGSGAPSIARRIEQENILRSFKQGTVPLHVYVESFTDQVDRCEAEGSTFADPSLLVGISIWGLNIDIFAEYIYDYNDAPASKPGTLGEVMTDASEFYESRMTTDPRLRGVLKGIDPTGNLGAYEAEATKGIVDDVPKIHTPPPCQLCDKGKHSAKECLKLLDEEYVSGLQEIVKSLKKSLKDKRKSYSTPGRK